MKDFIILIKIYYYYYHYFLIVFIFTTTAIIIIIDIMNNDAMETAVEYMWVDIWYVLYWIIELCHKTAEMHISLAGIAQLVSKQNEMLLLVVVDWDEMCCKLLQRNPGA